mgnify:CR=1 FL=1
MADFTKKGGPRLKICQKNGQTPPNGRFYKTGVPDRGGVARRMKKSR